MSPRSLVMASKGRRTPGKPGRFDPTEPLHMTTRHAARNGRTNGTSPTNDSVDESDSRRSSIDDFRPTTSQSLGSQSSSKGRRVSGNSTIGPAEMRLFFGSRTIKNSLEDDVNKALSPGLLLPSPSRKRKRSSPTPPHTPDEEDDVATPPKNVLRYPAPRDVVEVVPAELFSDRESDGTADSDDEQYRAGYGDTIQSTGITPEATPAGSGAVSPGSEESQDGLFASKPADVVMVDDADQNVEMEDPDELDDAEEIEDGDDIDDDVDDQGRIGADGKPRRRLAGRRRADHPDPIIEATLRRQLQLKSAYRSIARALKPVLAEIALKTTEELHANPVLHEQSIEYHGTGGFPGIQQILNEHLAIRKTQLRAQLRWNKFQLQQTLDGESRVRKSRCGLQVEDLQQLQIDRLWHDVLTLARQIQLSNDNVGYETEDEDADVIPVPKGVGYRFQRSDALDSKYDSRSRFALESERAIDELKIRFEMQQMIRDTRADEEGEDNAPAETGFTVMDHRVRKAAEVRREGIRNTDILATAAAEAERLAVEVKRKVKIPVIANEEAVGLQILGDLALRPSPLPPPALAAPAPPPLPPPTRQREQPFGPPIRTHVQASTSLHHAPPSLRPPISFERRPHDPPPRTTAFPDGFNPPPPPSLTARPEHIPGATRRLAEPFRRVAEPVRRVPESPRRIPESAHPVQESPRSIPESPRRIPEFPLHVPESPRRPAESPRHEPQSFLSLSTMRGNAVPSLSLRPPTSALPPRREPSPVLQKQSHVPERNSAGPRPLSSNQAGRDRRDLGDSDLERFNPPRTSPRVPPLLKRSIHEFSFGGPLSIERVEPIEARQVQRDYQAPPMQQDGEAARDESFRSAHLSKKPTLSWEPPSNPEAQDLRHMKEFSSPAPLAELMRDSSNTKPRSRASSVSQSTANEASPDDNNVSDPGLRRPKYKTKSHGFKPNKAERNGLPRKAFKQKNNGPTIHRFRLGQMETTPTSIPTSASWHSTHLNEHYAQYAYGPPPHAVGPPVAPTTQNFSAPYAQGYGQQYQHRNSLPQLGTADLQRAPQPPSPLYAVPQSSQQVSAGPPTPQEHWPPPPGGYSGASSKPGPGPPMSQAQNPVPGPYNPQYGGPPIAPATPDARLMQAATGRHQPAFAQQKRKEESSTRRRTHSDAQAHKFQYWAPRRS